MIMKLHQLVLSDNWNMLRMFPLFLPPRPANQSFSKNTQLWDRRARLLAPKLTSYACALLIDNVGNYLFLSNGSFKFEVDPHQFNLRLHHFSQFQRKGNTLEKKIQKLADLWLVGKMVNRIGIYGSKVAEGLSAFQRRSCCIVAVCIETVKHSLVCFNSVQGLFHSAHGECTAKVEWGL